jgi:hypothetical protein
MAPLLEEALRLGRLWRDEVFHTQGAPGLGAFTTNRRLSLAETKRGGHAARPFCLAVMNSSQ